MNDLPKISNKCDLAIICEGDEEYAYLDRLLKLNVWNEVYKFHLFNACGSGNIVAFYQDLYQNENYDIVLIFCDTDKKQNSHYYSNKEKIAMIHGFDEAADYVTIFGNPCTMDIMIKHFKDIKLKSQSKKVNSCIIEECTGIKNYDAHERQIHELMNLITYDNYVFMKNRIANSSNNERNINSTNFQLFIERLEKADISWINNINDILLSED